MALLSRMRLSIVLILQLWAQWISSQDTLQSCSSGYLESKSLSFNGTGGVTIIKQFPTGFGEFTVCFWAKLLNHDSPTLGYVFHMATTQDPKEVVIALGIRNGDPTMSVTILSHDVIKVVPSLADLEFHHMCVTWESLNGNLKMYNDGILFNHVPNQHKGKTLNSYSENVQLSLGQTYAGFQSFLGPSHFYGDIIHLNMWSSVLEDSEIEQVGVDYGRWCGDLLGWTAITESQVDEGIIEEVSPLPALALTTTQMVDGTEFVSSPSLPPTKVQDDVTLTSSQAQVTEKMTSVASKEEVSTEKESDVKPPKLVDASSMAPVNGTSGDKERQLGRRGAITIIIILVIITFILLVAAIIVTFFCCKKCKRRHSKSYSV
ncbi:uncharacterized protein LOC144438597 [Glandiceps talaboti]